MTLNRIELRGDKIFWFVIFLLSLGINQDLRLKAFLLTSQKGNKRLIFFLIKKKKKKKGMGVVDLAQR